MKKLFSTAGDGEVEVGHLRYSTMYLQDVTVSGIVEPNYLSRNGAVLIRSDTWERPVHPFDIGAEFREIPYEGPRGDPAVTFNTTAYPFKFKAGDKVLPGLANMGGQSPKITSRHYNADDGNAYYLVMFPTGNTRIWRAEIVEQETPPSQ